MCAVLWPDRCFSPLKQSLNPSGLTLFLSPSMHPIQLLQKAPSLEKRLPDYCAVTMFVYLLTTKGYNFNNNSFPNIAFRKKVGNARAHPHPMVSAWSQARKFCRRESHTKKELSSVREDLGEQGQDGTLGVWVDLLGGEKN